MAADDAAVAGRTTAGDVACGATDETEGGLDAKPAVIGEAPKMEGDGVGPNAGEVDGVSANRAVAASGTLPLTLELWAAGELVNRPTLLLSGRETDAAASPAAAAGLAPY